jgi:hypothetical protein
MSGAKEKSSNEALLLVRNPLTNDIKTMNVEMDVDGNPIVPDGVEKGSIQAISLKRFTEYYTGAESVSIVIGLDDNNVMVMKGAEFDGKFVFLEELD